MEIGAAGYNGYFVIEYQNEIEEYGTFRHDSLFAGQRQIADGTGHLVAGQR